MLSGLGITAAPSRVKDVITNSAALQVVRARFIACLDFSALMAGLLVWHLADDSLQPEQPLNGRLGFNFESTCGTEWPACPMQVACYNSVDFVVWCPTRHQYVFGERHPSDWGSKRAGQHVDSDCTWLEPAQNGSHFSCFLPNFGRPVLSIASLSFYVGWSSQSDLRHLDFPFFCSVRHNSCANWWLVSGPVGMSDRAVPIKFSVQPGSRHPCADAILGFFYMM